MSDCQITDKWGYRTGASSGAVTGLQNQIIQAFPDANNHRFTDSGGQYRITAQNPNITTPALQQGITVQTDSGGNFTLYLPQQGSSKPTSPVPQWSIQFPDGKILTGAVPNVAGPLFIDDLITTYSWTWANVVYTAPTAPGVLVRGTAVFTAASLATVLFSAPFAAATYNIKLSASVDSVTGNVPSVGWSAKATSGFTINAVGVFTGSVDWEAVL